MHIPTTKLQIFFDLRKRMRSFLRKKEQLGIKNGYFQLSTFNFQLFFVLLHAILYHCVQNVH